MVLDLISDWGSQVATSWREVFTVLSLLAYHFFALKQLFQVESTSSLEEVPVMVWNILHMDRRTFPEKPVTSVLFKERISTTMLTLLYVLHTLLFVLQTSKMICDMASPFCLHKSLYCLTAVMTMEGASEAPEWFLETSIFPRLITQTESRFL